MMGKLTKKDVNLGGLAAEVYRILGHTGLVSEVIKKTGKSKFSVSRVIKQLVDKGLVKRLDKGVYKVVNTSGVVFPVNQFPTSTKFNASVDTSKPDYLRLHALQVRLRLNVDLHRDIRSCIIKKQFFTNIRSGGNNGQYYCSVPGSVALYQVGRDNVHITFPEDFELLGDSINVLGSKVYDCIEEQVQYLERLMKRAFFKDGRVNFEITKVHIALVNNGVVKEMKSVGVTNLAVYDDTDGKIRFLWDWSKGLPELEAVHTVKGFDDADSAKRFMNTLKDGSYHDMYENYKSFFDGPDKDSLATFNKKLTMIMDILKVLSESQVETQSEIKTLVNVDKFKDLLRNTSLPFNHTDDVSYIG